ncbi:uncharacterized protein H6S33_004248 [Morchella sextelata]|uniref:uncharacterized protein n=1 Tax=Morchella sextelata TaxID=1174677 RepID=UPI001D03D139|nr:uncharacterized protein H6S33_004248 [Morchella sextelata]KAH0605791.1 hypothetical protein H6S33_004248 [Morchella sextelata]
MPAPPPPFPHHKRRRQSPPMNRAHNNDQDRLLLFVLLPEVLLSLAAAQEIDQAAVADECRFLRDTTKDVNLNVQDWQKASGAGSVTIKSEF